MKILDDKAKIAIINRGESAYRFIRAVKEYNLDKGTSLKTVVFYTANETNALFVSEADEAYPFHQFKHFEGLKESEYLCYPLLLEAIAATGCNAVWLGWGFVSEDAQFVKLAEEANLVLLAPSSSVIEQLGDKISSKHLAHQSDTPICPWSEGPVDSLEEAYKVAKRIGYPLVVKASNAGGGRGIRFVFNENEMEGQYQSALEETLRVTGTRLMFIERLVEEGRHLEVQALADHLGNIKTFGVRDCSVQRKNQKIIEQTPPQGIAAEELTEIQKAAYRLLKLVGYTSAGTVEFLYDLKRKAFYFMEVNTRLQVEHPITELLFDIDLVAGQIDVARGLSIEHYNTIPNGCVIEARLNAEDPENNFRAAGGEIKLFRPAGGIGVRIDSAVSEGGFIPPQFDSMIAKIIVKAPTHSLAMARLRRAIDETKIKIEGGTTNRNFILELLELKEIRQSQVSTLFVEHYLKHRPNRKNQANLALCVAAAHLYCSMQQNNEQQFNAQMLLAGFARNQENPNNELNLKYEDEIYSLSIRRLTKNLFAINNKTDKEGTFYFNYDQTHDNLLVFNGQKYKTQIDSNANTLRVELNNIVYLIYSDDGGVVKATSPALLLKINVTVGQKVKIGDTLFSLEAMKMEIPVLANTEGVISQILANAGTQVVAGQSIIKIDRTTTQQNTHTVQKLFDQQKPHTLNYQYEIPALLMGYDGLKFKQLQTLVPAPVDGLWLIEMFKLFITIEQLFSNQILAMKGYTHLLSYMDYLVLYYRSFTKAETDYPSAFNAALTEVAKIYGVTKKTEEDALIYTLFKSHKALKTKEQILEFLLKQLTLCPTEYQNLFTMLIKALDTLSPKLSALCKEKRFNFFDQPLLAKLDEKRLNKLKQALTLLEDKEIAGKDRHLLKATQYGSISEPYLYTMALAGNAIALKVLGYRFYRDCTVMAYQPLEHFAGGASLQYKDHSNQEKTSLIVVATSLSQLSSFTKGHYNRLIVLVNHPFTKTDLQTIAGAKNLSIGLVQPHQVSYSNYKITEAGQWQPDNNRNALSPLTYRELRIYRLNNFIKTFYPVSDDSVIIHTTSPNQVKDERLFAFLNIENSAIELDSSGKPMRLLGFEEPLQGMISALRHYQLQQKKPLHWNRLVIFICPPLRYAISTIESYAKDLVEQYFTNDLGLVQVSIYVRDKKHNVTELVINNMGSSLSINQRIAKTTLLQPLTPYDAKVLQAKSRNLTYPYQLLRNLTQGAILKGTTTFTEYDLNEQETPYAVSNRPYGENKANVVFGLIETTLEKVCYKRIIILSDPTTDMGSLAEGECKRINAAITLATQLKLPIEWLPVSSGARIDMQSGTENLDWTASTLKHIIQFTQDGGEINVIVGGTNVGAQSYWNSEATMLMHCRGLLIMTSEGSMLLTGKKALDFSGSVSADTNLEIGGAKYIMNDNGEAQIEVKTLNEAFAVLMHHYKTSYALKGHTPIALPTSDDVNRNMALTPYNDELGQGFKTIGDIFSETANADKKKAFDTRSVMQALTDADHPSLERWAKMANAQTAIVWQSRIGGYATGLIGIESKSLVRHGMAPFNGPQSYAGGTLYPLASKKIARAINSFSGRLPLVVLANLSGFDGSPESLQKNQLEWGAEIGRAIVNFQGPILFVVTGRYHGGAYVVFSKKLNPNLKTVALQGSFASVIGGAPAAAVVFPSLVAKDCYADERIKQAQQQLDEGKISPLAFDSLYKTVYTEKQTEWAKKFDQFHSVERAKQVGSIDDIIDISQLRPYVINFIKQGNK